MALNKTKYIQEATFMLSDKKTYEPLKKDPTNTIRNKVNNIIKLWKSKNYINEKIAYYFKSSNPLPTRFYGLPKIHKPNHPLRPIVPVPHGQKIISLDAVSLFTNVQIGIAIKGIKDRWPQIQPHIKMPWCQFENGLSLLI